MRTFFFVQNGEGGARLELEDPYFSQYLPENSCVYLEDKMYRVKTIKKKLIQAGNSLDCELEVWLE